MGFLEAPCVNLFTVVLDSKKEQPWISQRVRTRLISSYLGSILRSACYSAGLGLVLSPKINLKLGRVL